jgi:hypothetical protein
MRRAIGVVFALALGLSFGARTRGDEAKDLENLRTALLGAVAKFEAAANTDRRIHNKCRDVIYSAMDKAVEKLRPKSGSKTYRSEDRKFVVVISANGNSIAERGEQAIAKDDDAFLVVAIAGDGGPSGNGKIGGAGGAAQASAAKGIAIALAGRGGIGGGGGGGGGAVGTVGFAGFGGAGGKGGATSGQGGDGGGSGISDASALRQALVGGVKEKSADDEKPKRLK